MPGVVVFPESDSFVVALARWLAPPAEQKEADGPPPPPSPFESECAQMEQGGKVEPLAAKLRASLLERLLKQAAKEADARNAFGLFLELLVQWQLLAAQAESLAAELSASPEAQPELKCTLLLALYSAVQQHGTLELRFALLLALIAFCARTERLGKVLGAVDERIARVERWVTEWELTGSQQKALWALVFDAHVEHDLILYECALKYLTLHSPSDVAGSAELKSRVVKSVLLTIKSPSLFRCDELAQLPVVQAMKDDPEYAPLHALLQIVARDTYAEWSKFAEKSDAFLTKHNLPKDKCADKMRLLTLVSLGHSNKELPYASVASALKVGVPEVETWVMLAIGNGLITAKMDQVREVVAVSTCAERDFGMKQWERLHTSLVDWRDSIHGLLDVLQKSREQGV